MGVLGTCLGADSAEGRQGGGWIAVDGPAGDPRASADGSCAAAAGGADEDPCGRCQGAAEMDFRAGCLGLGDVAGAAVIGAVGAAGDGNGTPSDWCQGAHCMGDAADGPVRARGERRGAATTIGGGHGRFTAAAACASTGG